MEITRSQQGAATILALKGAFMTDELEKFDATLLECMNAGMLKIVLDMRQVPFVDSVGLERLLDAVGELGRRGGDLRAVSLNDTCRDIFKVTLMESFVPVYDDHESAVRSL
jgi:anti-sigma B factor antagonist